MKDNYIFAVLHSVLVDEEWYGSALQDGVGDRRRSARPSKKWRVADVI